MERLRLRRVGVNRVSRTQRKSQGMCSKQEKQPFTRWGISEPWRMSCSWEEIAATLREVFHVLSGVALVGAILQYWCYLLLADHIGRISRLHPSEMGSMVVIPAIADQATSYNFPDSQQGQDRCLLSYKSYPVAEKPTSCAFCCQCCKYNTWLASPYAEDTQSLDFKSPKSHTKTLFNETYDGLTPDLVAICQQCTRQRHIGGSGASECHHWPASRGFQHVTCKVGVNQICGNIKLDQKHRNLMNYSPII